MGINLNNPVLNAQKMQSLHGGVTTPICQTYFIRPSMEQSSRHTATTRRRTQTVQTSFKDIFVLRGCSALVTLSAFNALCINLLTHSLTHSDTK